MKRYIHQLLVLTLLLLVGSCGKKDPDPQAQLPGYLRIPAKLDGYEGSGLITMTGDLNLRAEGPETLDPSTKTYSGVQGAIVFDDINAQFTVGQPRIYKESALVAYEYQANGQLLTLDAMEPGTYPMGFQSGPTPAGARTDLIMNLPGPQLYQARQGTLTISESTIIKTEGKSQLYRIQGTFQVALLGNGAGTLSNKDYNVTGTFDLLLLAL